uniref:Ribonuclease H2 subunit B n=1 Tax=Sarcoptes scabiei TaxID=52283 RepID=A0A834R4P7_SARSC
MSKIFILPNRNETKAIKLKAIQLKHPRSKSNCTYFIDQDNRYILELCIKANPFHSWFCDDLLLKDGNLYTLTPIDPLFILIPILKNSKQKNFQSFYDICLEDDCEQNLIDLINFYNDRNLKCVCDVKNFENDFFIKFSKERTLRWLRLKFNQILKHIIDNSLNDNSLTDGFSLIGYTRSSKDLQISQDHHNQFAFEILSEYIDVDLQEELRSYLRLPIKQPDKIHKQGANENKRKFETEKINKTSKDNNGHLEVIQKQEPDISNKNLNKRPRSLQKDSSKSKQMFTTRDISNYFLKKKP